MQPLDSINYLQSRETLHAQCQYQSGWSPPSNNSDLRASLIIPSLYLSDYYSATSPTILHELGITHILCIAHNLRCYYPVERSLAVLCIQVVDSDMTKIEEYFDSSTACRDVLANGESKLLVHCASGVGRSATIVITYLMAAKGMSYANAFSHVYARRKMICPNDGFRLQLISLELRLTGLENSGTKPVEKHGMKRTAGYPKTLVETERKLRSSLD
jgi:atypical dual specificity phosphatase